MGDERRYTTDALLADLTNRHHHPRMTSEGEAERRMRKHYPKAVAILVRPEESWRQESSPSRSRPVP